MPKDFNFCPGRVSPEIFPKMSSQSFAIVPGSTWWKMRHEGKATLGIE
jgi:hypothetical protein